VQSRESVEGNAAARGIYYKNKLAGERRAEKRRKNFETPRSLERSMPLDPPCRATFLVYRGAGNKNSAVTIRATMQITSRISWTIFAARC